MPFRRGWAKVKKWIIHLLHLDDSAHRIALGVAIGMFVAVTPTWGIQMLLVVGLAWLCRANKVAGIPLVWVTNPATNVPIYSFCYIVGRALVGGPGLEEVKQALALISMGDLGWGALAKGWANLMWHAAAPLWVGTCVVGAVCGAITYVIMYCLITFYRRHHRPHLVEDSRAPAALPTTTGEGAAAPPDNAGGEGP